MSSATPEPLSEGAVRGRRLALVGVLAFSLAANLFLAHQALRLHRARTLLTLDPPPLTRFESENRSLGPPAVGRVRLVYFGDSRIAEWTRLPEPGAAESINRGYPGDTTATALLRVREDVLALDPALVVLQIGINDLKAIAVLPERAAAIVRSARRNVSSLVGVLRARGIEVVVLTVWPRGPVDLRRLPFWGPRVDRAILEFNSYLVTLRGEGVSVVDCDPILSLLGRIDPRYSRDMLHLNAAGYERLNTHLTRHLDTLVARLASGRPVQFVPAPPAGRPRRASRRLRRRSVEEGAHLSRRHRGEAPAGGFLVVDNMLWGGRIFDPADRSRVTEGIRASSWRIGAGSRRSSRSATASSSPGGRSNAPLPRKRPSRGMIRIVRWRPFRLTCVPHASVR